MTQSVSSKGPLSKPTTATEFWRRERVFMPNLGLQREDAIEMYYNMALTP